ncbi:MAG: hypothetical protein IKH30_16745, partial [Clostridia bacterium]|nr:hypothetical protein [Clostridia bacterium]
CRPASAKNNPPDCFSSASAPVFLRFRFLSGTISHPASEFTIQLGEQYMSLESILRLQLLI